MTEANKILELIENVDPEDNDALDEIDARVWCLLYFVKFLRLCDNDHYFAVDKEGEYLRPLIRYTRSRDALKHIRPEGWYFTHGNEVETQPVNRMNFSLVKNPVTVKYDCYAYKYQAGCNRHPYVEAPESPTEELAELHAIIQAIEYERSKKHD